MVAVTLKGFIAWVGSHTDEGDKTKCLVLWSGSQVLRFAEIDKEGLAPTALEDDGLHWPPFIRSCIAPSNPSSLVWGTKQLQVICR